MREGNRKGNKKDKDEMIREKDKKTCEKKTEREREERKRRKGSKSK